MSTNLEGKPWDHLNNAEKVFEKNPTPFHDKTSQQTRNQRELPQPDKGRPQKTCTNVALDRRGLSPSCCNPEQRG